MYVHIIRSGKYNQYVKRLLREVYRSGLLIRNRTILNLSNWGEDRIGRLQGALELKRRHSGTGSILEREADSRILGVIGEHGWARPDLIWRVLCSLGGNRPVGSRSGVVTAPNGISDQPSRLTTITEEEAIEWMSPRRLDGQSISNVR